MREFGHTFLGLRFACQWAERNASGPFSCFIACILGEGADVPVEIDCVCGIWMRIDNVRRVEAA